MLKTKTLMAAAVTSIMVAGASHAEVLASTDFDSSSIGTSTNIKTGLNWTLNGLDDPGDMEADRFGGADQAIFNGTAFVQDNFTPGMNVGNASGTNTGNVANSSWVTEVSLTVASGFTVTLEDVTLKVISVSGGQVGNVARRNDYTLTLLNPSAGVVEEITIADTVADGALPGISEPTITFDFADVALNLPGTYTLRIRGGDYTGTNETGNHTGIDNLSINGTAAPVPEPGSLALLGLGGLLIARRRRG